MANIRKALGYSIVSTYINRAIGMLSIVIIARLLTPEELGIFSIAAAIALIIAEFKSFGVGAYLIRSDNLDDNLVAKALGLNALISWTAGFIVFFAAWSIESYYGKQDIAILLQILSLSFFLNPHTSIAKSLMQRQFLFDRIMLIDVLSNIIKFALTLILIYADFSYFALAIATSSGFVVEFLLVLYLRPAHFVFLPHFRGVRELMNFGIFVTLGQFFRTLNTNLPDLFIGKMGTASEVAFFSRALGLLSFVNMTISSGIRPVVMPYLANKKRAGEDVGEAYMHASQLMSCIIVPIIAVCGYASHSIIVFMFGDQWHASISILTILSVAYVFRVIHALSPQMFVASGLEKITLIKDASLLLISAILITNLYPMGLDYVAAGVVLTAVINFIMISLLLKLNLALSLKKQLYSILPNIVLSLICVAWAAFLDHFIISLDAQNPFIEVPLLGASCAVVWLATIFAIRHPLRDEIAALLRKIVKKK